MSVRRLLAGVATTSLIAVPLAFAAPAQADPAFAPDADDIVGGGSDTSMYALSYLADGHNGVPGYNAANPTQRLVSWDANIYNSTGTQTNSAQVTLRAGSAPITRPNGSGGGLGLLFGAGNNPDLNFARSSSALNATQAAAGLQAFPFARDDLGLATAKTTNAPATITPAQMVAIYKGEITNWNQIAGGSNGTIVPMIPQSGSGTRSFFEGQLKAANGGTAVTLAGHVQVVQEHDAAPVVANANAVAPFSVGRNAVSGDTLKIAGGFTAARALYNVVRQADVNAAWAEGIFGRNGFVCKPEAKPLIEAAGFSQLATVANGGACGVATQAAESNLLTSQVVDTTTTVAGVSNAAGALDLTATVAAGGASPSGLVRFYLDGSATPSGNPAPLTGGKATVKLTGVTAGAHKVVAKFTPSIAAYKASASAPTDVVVKSAGEVKPPSPQTPDAEKAKTTLKSKFKKSVKKAKSYQGKIVVAESAEGSATGKVSIKVGKKTYSAKVKNGVATIKLKGLKKGKNKLKATYGGDANFLDSKLKFTITVK